MEQTFQTSFMPKKPIIDDGTKPQKKSVGILMVVSIFLVLSMLIAFGALYLYQGILKQSINSMQADLSIAKERFEPEKITQLTTLDKRLRASEEILSRHISITPIFRELGDITMKSIRYTKFDYELGVTPGSRVVVHLSGEALGYRSVALQSDLFTKNKNFLNPIFSNLRLDEKGNVVFDLEFAVEPSFVNYKNVIDRENINQ